MLLFTIYILGVIAVMILDRQYNFMYYLDPFVDYTKDPFDIFIRTLFSIFISILWPIILFLLLIFLSLKVISKALNKILPPFKH